MITHVFGMNPLHLRLHLQNCAGQLEEWNVASDSNSNYWSWFEIEMQKIWQFWFHNTPNGTRIISALINFSKKKILGVQHILQNLHENLKIFILFWFISLWFDFKKLKTAKCFIVELCGYSNPQNHSKTLPNLYKTVENLYFWAFFF